MTRPAGRVTRFSKTQSGSDRVGSGRVGSGQAVFQIPRVESGGIRSSRVRSGRAGPPSPGLTRERWPDSLNSLVNMYWLCLPKKKVAGVESSTQCLPKFPGWFFTGHDLTHGSAHVESSIQYLPNFHGGSNRVMTRPHGSAQDVFRNLYSRSRRVGSGDVRDRTGRVGVGSGGSQISRVGSDHLDPTRLARNDTARENPCK